MAIVQSNVDRRTASDHSAAAATNDLRDVSIPNPRRTLRWVWIYFLYWSGLSRWAEARIASLSGIVVLTLHRVLQDSDLSSTNTVPGMILKQSTFESLLKEIRKRSKIFTPSGASPSWNEESGKTRIAITFDDGWEDNSRVVLPLLQRHRCLCTVFVCPELVGKSNPFWPEKIVSLWRSACDKPARLARLLAASNEYGLSVSSNNRDKLIPQNLIAQLKERKQADRNRIIEELFKGQDIAENVVDSTMKWQEIIQLAKSGNFVGSHTQHHEILTSLPALEARTELVSSKQAVEQALGVECALFAYPNGSWSPGVCELVKEAGYSIAFSNDVGVWTALTDRHLVPRVNIWEGSIVGPSGRFSPAAFTYAVFWRSYRAEARARRRREVRSKTNES